MTQVDGLQAAIPDIDWDAPTEEKLAAIEPFDDWIAGVEAIDGPDEFDELRDGALQNAKASAAWVREMAENGESDLPSPTGAEITAGMTNLGAYCITG